VRLFGAFRNFIDRSEVECSLPSGATQAELKMELAKILSFAAGTAGASGKNPEALLAESALADETKILANSDPLRDGMRLALLPPVCGG
jgi:molybdopterin converting factor small subunit